MDLYSMVLIDRASKVFLFERKNEKEYQEKIAKAKQIILEHYSVKELPSTVVWREEFIHYRNKTWCRLSLRKKYTRKENNNAGTI